jgi:hypothetical protein
MSGLADKFIGSNHWSIPLFDKEGLGEIFFVVTGKIPLRPPLTKGDKTRLYCFKNCFGQQWDLAGFSLNQTVPLQFGKNLSRNLS